MREEQETCRRKNPALFTFRLLPKRGAHCREVGILTCRSQPVRNLPIPNGTVVFCDWLAAYSGGTVRDFHPLPFSLAFDGEYLEAHSSYHHCKAKHQSRLCKIPRCSLPSECRPRYIAQCQLFEYIDF